MVDLQIWTLLGLIYDVEKKYAFRRLRRELERYYRLQNKDAYRRDAYIDSMLTLLFEHEYDYEGLTAGQ